MRQLGFLRCNLQCFETVSRLNINLAKSKLIQIREISDIASMAWILGCKNGRLSLGASFKSKIVWEPVVEKFACRLKSWKATLLPTGGRVTLLKSNLASIPNYSFPIFTIL